MISLESHNKLRGDPEKKMSSCNQGEIRRAMRMKWSAAMTLVPVCHPESAATDITVQMWCNKLIRKLLLDAARCCSRRVSISIRVSVFQTEVRVVLCPQPLTAVWDLTCTCTCTQELAVPEDLSRTCSVSDLCASSSQPAGVPLRQG